MREEGDDDRPSPASKKDHDHRSRDSRSRRCHRVWNIPEWLQDNTNIRNEMGYLKA